MKLRKYRRMRAHAFDHQIKAYATRRKRYSTRKSLLIAQWARRSGMRAYRMPWLVGSAFGYIQHRPLRADTAWFDESSTSGTFSAESWEKLKPQLGVIGFATTPLPKIKMAHCRGHSVKHCHTVGMGQTWLKYWGLAMRGVNPH